MCVAEKLFNCALQRAECICHVQVRSDPTFPNFGVKNMVEQDGDERRNQLRDIFTEMITAYGRKDFETFESYLQEDAVFEWPFRPLEDFPDSMVGSANFVAASREGMADCHPYNHKVDRFYDQLDAEMLIVEYHSDTIHIPSNKRYANRYLGILRFSGNKVALWREYVNPLPILNVYGADFVNKSACTSRPDDTVASD